MILLEASIQLVPDGTLLLHLVMVCVMVVVLNRTLLKPINQILAEREKQIAGRRQEAEAMALETQEKLKKYSDALRDARADGTRRHRWRHHLDGTDAADRTGAVHVSVPPRRARQGHLAPQIRSRQLLRQRDAQESADSVGHCRGQASECDLTQR